MNLSTGANRERLRDIARRAMVERGLAPDIPPAARAEAEAAGPAVAAAGSTATLRDERARLWSSIDNDDSRDLDQLTVAEPLEGGAVRVFVAIADVDALVPKGGAMDDHARRNTTSVYTPAEVFHMLPERLSTHLTSLNEDQERLAVVVGLVVEPDGTIAESDVQRAVVFNHAKLAYNGVAAWLDGAAPPPPRVASVAGLAEQIRLQDAVAQAMKRRRHEHGALTLETAEARPVFDGDLLVELRTEPKNRVRVLIEELMIAANSAVAARLEAVGFPSLRRVLRAPARWDRIVELASAAGERLAPEPDAVALEQFLRRRRQADAARFPELSLSIVKLLGGGEYAVGPGETAGHFGLAVRDYAHSTAPNRRFPDLVTQRLLKAALDGQPPPYDVGELTALAAHCTEQEDDAGKVERQVKKSAAALLLSSRIGERYEGIVTGASPKATWVRLTRPIVDGRLVRGMQGLDVGDAVQVELVAVDVEHGFIDFARVS